MKWLVFAMAAVFGLGSMMVAAACSEEDDSPPAIVGEWEAAEDWYGFTDELEIEDDLKGEAKIGLIYDDEEDVVSYCEYDVEAEKDGDTWVLDLECDVDSYYDFEMECEIDGDEMECEGSDGHLDNVEFEWEKQ